MRRPTVWVLALAACVLGGSTVDPPDRPAAFTLGVMRRDGILIPFANFDGRRWQNTWPMPPKKVEVPITTGDVPSTWWPRGVALLSWTLWTADGDAHGVQVTAPAWTPVQCQGLVGLRTTLVPTPPLPPPVVQPYPKLGLVVSGSQVVEPVTIVNGGSDDWKRIEALLSEPFNQAENDATVQQVQYGWAHPVGREERASRPIALEAVYRAPFVTPGTFAYYVEASRRYEWSGSQEAEPCDLVTFAGGWVTIDRDGHPSVKLMAVVTDCQRWNTNVLYPLGVLRVGDRYLWVGQWSGWENESYAVVEIEESAASKALVSTSAGTCW